MSNFITVSEFCEKHGVGRNNALSFINKGKICSVALKTDKTPYLIDEEYIVAKKAISDGVRSDLQLWCTRLLENMSLSSIVRLCMLCGADVTYGYGREVLNSKLWHYKKTSVLSYRIDEKLYEMWQAMSWLAGLVDFVGSYDEDELCDYICFVRNIPKPAPVAKKKKIYIATCTKCGENRQLSSRPKGKTGLCQKCTVKVMNKNNIKDSSDLKRWWYFCPTCPSVRAVKQKRKTPYCQECIKKVNKKKTINPKKKKYTPIGTDGARRNKVTVKPRKKKEVTYPKTSRERELEMIEEFLAKEKTS